MEDAREAAVAERVPTAVRELLERIEAAGREALLVGGCVRDLLAGRPVDDFDVATDAPPEAILELFPRAVPIGLRHGTVMVPTAAGPVDVTRYRGPDLAGDLARRDFTLNAIAFDLRRRRALDPHGGRQDWRAGRLRAVGDPRERLAEDPLRALRAARFVATLGVAADAELEAALPSAAPGLATVAGERIREELARLLLGARAGEGLALLARSGLAAVLAPGTRPDAAAVVAALPPVLELRLAAWLRGTRVASVLARLRTGRARARRVEQLLRHHPVEETLDPRALGAVRRLLARIGGPALRDLIALREAELEASGEPDPEGVRARLDALRAAVARVEASGSLALGRQDLALDGRAIMELLRCPPGPIVGRALRHLTERVLDDPDLNTPERLRVVLNEWKAAGNAPAASAQTRSG